MDMTEDAFERSKRSEGRRIAGAVERHRPPVGAGLERRIAHRAGVPVIVCTDIDFLVDGQPCHDLAADAELHARLAGVNEKAAFRYG